MARSINEIRDEIVAAKAAEPGLDGLTSTSQVSVWRLWAAVVAAAIWAVEVLYDQLRADIDGIVARNVPGTAAWYVEQAYKFQLGDALEVVEGRAGYRAADQAKQIIKRAACSRLSNGNAILKVAKEVAGEPAGLSPAELVQFNGYVANLMFAGSFIQTRSLPADDFQVFFQVVYDAQYALPDVRARVERAVLDKLASVPFDARFRKSALVDAVQVVLGVVDVKVVALRAKASTANSYVEIDIDYEAQSGYGKIAAAFPLSGSLTFSPA